MMQGKIRGRDLYRRGNLRAIRFGPGDIRYRYVTLGAYGRPLRAMTALVAPDVEELKEADRKPIMERSEFDFEIV